MQPALENEMGGKKTASWASGVVALAVWATSSGTGWAGPAPGTPATPPLPEVVLSYTIEAPKEGGDPNADADGNDIADQRSTVSLTIETLLPGQPIERFTETLQFQLTGAAAACKSRSDNAMCDTLPKHVLGFWAWAAGIEAVWIERKGATMAIGRLEQAEEDAGKPYRRVLKSWSIPANATVRIVNP
jgi:hypothetical protein